MYRNTKYRNPHFSKLETEQQPTYKLQVMASVFFKNWVSMYKLKVNMEMKVSPSKSQSFEFWDNFTVFPFLKIVVYAFVFNI